VKAPDLGGPVSKERLKELHVGGHNDRSIPVLSSKATPLLTFFIVMIMVTDDVGMVFQDRVIAEDSTKDVSRLLDDRGIGNDIDDTLHTVCDSMVHGKGQG
jgi:hypothetical protein